MKIVPNDPGIKISAYIEQAPLGSSFESPGAQEALLQEVSLDGLGRH